MKAIMIGTAAIAVLFAAGIWRQRVAATELRAELTLAQLEQAELSAVEAQRGRLAAAQIPAAELQRLGADRAAMNRLRQELETLKDRVAAKRSPAAASMAPAADVLPPPTATEGPVSEEFLRNLGLGTPAAAVETALWAATGGDLETLVGTLLLEGEAGAKAGQLLAALPPEAREQYRTPEHLVAALTAREIPLTGIQIMPPKTADPAATRVLARMQDSDRKIRMVALSLRQMGDEWKLVVPTSAVEKFGRMLGGDAPATTVK